MRNYVPKRTIQKMGSTIYGFKNLMTNGIKDMRGQNRRELKAKGVIRYE
jgi:hypothetical protein